MKFNVTAQSFNRETGEPSGLGRTELIDTNGNELFAGCTSDTNIRC